MVAEIMNQPTGGLQGTALVPALGRRLQPVAATSVARLRAIGAKPGDGRAASPAREHDDVARPFSVPAPREVPARAQGREGGALAPSWPPFVVQNLAQQLAPEPELDEQESQAARLVYRAAAERGTVYLGVVAPVDIVV